MPLPQRIYAAPNFIGQDLKDTAPGHRFQLYLRHWQGPGENSFDAYKKARPQGKDERANFDRETANVLKELCPLPPSGVKALQALRTRQKALIDSYGTSGYRISTQSTAPFATGLGNEHPIENGFAFLTPYGLPYLAGSGVKGILRRTMQELRDEDEAGFTDAAIDALFGPENIDKPEDARRGALDFWDVFPEPAGGKLVVEIMTPHYSKYYQGKETPHDSGAPIPVSFLAVPAKSGFDFHVVCHQGRLPPTLYGQWRQLLDRAFDHAFAWVGFGAKTSVGYGAMTPAAAPSASATAPHSASGTTHADTTVAGGSTATQIWPTAKLTLNPGTGEIRASFESKATVGLKKPDSDSLFAALGEERANKLRKNKELKGVSVEVEANGNALRIRGLSPS